jgi:hypothetical protein
MYVNVSAAIIYKKNISVILKYVQLLMFLSYLFSPTATHASHATVKKVYRFVSLQSLCVGVSFLARRALQ